MTTTFAPRRTFTRPSERRVSLASLAITAAAITSSWTGLRLGTTGIADILLLVAIGLAVIEHGIDGRRLPIPLWAVAPTLTAFFIYAGNTLLTHSTATQSEDSGVTFVTRTFLGLTLVAILCLSEVKSFGAQRGQSLVNAWLVGILTSATIASTDSIGLTNLHSLVQHIESARSVGLTFHPNSLAQSAVLAIPLVAFKLAAPGTRWAMRAWWLAALFICLNALFLANSRGGLVVGLVMTAFTFTVILWRGGNRWLAPSAVILATVFVVPAVLDLLAGTRLAAGSAALSDALRMSFLLEGWESFISSPLIGAGLTSGAGVMVPLYLLSLGGALLAAAYYWFIGQNVAVMLARLADPLVAACLLSGIALLAMGLANNSVNERFDYWTICIGAAIAGLRHRRVTLPTTPSTV